MAILPLQRILLETTWSAVSISFIQSGPDTCDTLMPVTVTISYLSLFEKPFSSCLPAYGHGKD